MCLSRWALAVNCVANGALLREKIFDNIWIQPAAGDSSGALGAALFTWYLHHNKERVTSTGQDAMRGAYLGPEFTDEEIESDQQLVALNSKSFQKLK